MSINEKITFETESFVLDILRSVKQKTDKAYVRKIGTTGGGGNDMSALLTTRDPRPNRAGNFPYKCSRGGWSSCVKVSNIAFRGFSCSNIQFYRTIFNCLLLLGMILDFVIK